MFPPERIVCLTEETVETLYLLGEEDRIVGVSGYAVRPARVRKEKPRVSAFISADVPKILALKPDLVLTFSDLQADIVADLVRANIAVHAFNQRDIAGIFDMIRTLGALVGAVEKAKALARTLAARVDAVHERALRLPHRPRVYFEEWDDPMISGLGWVSELIECAGGIEVFPQLALRKNAKDRIVSGAEVIGAQPDIIIGSWCGKKFVPAKVAARLGSERVPAVATGWLRLPESLPNGPKNVLWNGEHEVIRIDRDADEQSAHRPLGGFWSSGIPDRFGRGGKAGAACAGLHADRRQCAVRRPHDAYPWARLRGADRRHGAQRLGAWARRLADFADRHVGGLAAGSRRHGHAPVERHPDNDCRHGALLARFLRDLEFRGLGVQRYLQPRHRRPDSVLRRGAAIPAKHDGGRFVLDRGAVRRRLGHPEPGSAGRPRALTTRGPALIAN